MKIDIDEALRSYVDEPVPWGMEARILSRCRRRVWIWPVFGLTAACCLLAMSVVRSPRVAPVMRYRSLTVTARPEPAAASAAKQRRRKPSGVNALWRFAQEHPEVAMQLTEEYNSKPIELLQIEPISIEELGDQ